MLLQTLTDENGSLWVPAAMHLATWQKSFCLFFFFFFQNLIKPKSSAVKADFPSAHGYGQGRSFEFGNLCRLSGLF